MAPDRGRAVGSAHGDRQPVPLTRARVVGVGEGYPTALPAGYHLARALGPQYRAVGLTHTADRVPEMDWPAEDSPVGFTVGYVPVDPPAPGSVEKALVDAGFGGAVTVTDVRAAEGLERIRSQSATMDVPVRETFDAVLSTPTATMDRGGS